MLMILYGIFMFFMGIYCIKNDFGHTMCDMLMICGALMVVGGIFFNISGNIV